MTPPTPPRHIPSVLATDRWDGEGHDHKGGGRKEREQQEKEEE